MPKKNPTSVDVTSALLGGPTTRQDDLAERVDVLSAIVLDLLTEMEALRTVLADDPAYRRCYRESSLLAHDARGCTTGAEKMILRYYPRQTSTGGRSWRESLMLQRLGFSNAEIARYREEAEEAETYT